MARKQSIPRPVLLGPDTKHGARKTRGFKKYWWYVEWYEGGDRRLQKLGPEYGQDYRDELQAVRDQVASSRIAPKGQVDAKIGVIVMEYLRWRMGDVHRPLFNSSGLKWRVVKLAEKLGNISVSRLSHEDIEQFSSEYSAGTARLMLGTLRTALKFGRDRKFYSAPLPTLRRPPKPRSKDRVFSRTEICKMVRLWRSRRETQTMATATLVAYYTAARIESVLSLRWERSNDGGWIDMRARMIHLNPHGRPDTKKKKPSIPIPVKLFTLLSAMHRHRAGRAVFPDRSGKSRTYKGFYYHWRRALEKLEIPHGGVHSLRHTRITELIAGGVPPAVVCTFVGADLATIMREYAHLMPGHAAEAAKFRR